MRLPALRKLLPVVLALGALAVLAAALKETDEPQVPGVVGLSFERAAGQLRKAGYVPVRGETRGAGGERCAVHRQRPAPFTVAPERARVRLDVDCDFVRY